MKQKRTVSRCVCFMLILVLLLNLVGCTKPQDGTTLPSVSTQAPTQSTTLPTQPTAPTTIPTDPTETEPTEPTPTQPDETPAQVNDLVYTLTQEDVDEFYRLLSECETLAVAGEDMDAIEAISDQLDEQYELLETQNSIAMILYYYDMKNERFTDLHLDCVEICTQANDAYMQAVQRIYLSDTPAKEMLFEGWTEKDIEMLLKYNEQVSLLQQRNSEIAVDYRAATTDEVRIPLYIEFVTNNNAIAQIYGYDNYYTYSYEVVYDRDYGNDKVLQMRQYAKDHLTLAFGSAATKFNREYQGLDQNEQQSLLSFLYYDYKKDTQNYIGQYLDAMPGELKTHVEYMLSNDSLFAKRRGSMSGAFTTMIGDRSYCFFGPDYTNCNTIIHEGGHYYASRYADLNSIPLDLAEVHSQGNEWLFIAHIEGLMKKDPYNAMVSYQMYNSLAMILICLMVDEFEQIVYSSDISAYTASDFDAIMDSVCAGYFDPAYAASNLTDVNAYWRQVVVEQPVYYISYAVSVIAAMDLYVEATEDFDAAAEIYRKLCEEPLLEEGFLANISAAGLSGPFDEKIYLDLAALAK